MSERLEHDDEQPVIRLGIGGERFEATPENSALYMFLGRLAVYNHVFLQTGDTEDNRTPGMYLFATTPVFDDLADFMSQNGFPMHVNLRTVSDGDKEAYEAMISQNTANLDDELHDLLGDGGATE